MNDLLDNVYLPDLKKRTIRESDAYKLLKDNNKDTSVLEGYENHPDAGTVNFESFDKFLGEGGTKEEWIARHATPEVQKEFFSNVGDFMLETGKDTVLSLATAVVNGADVATNLMPLFVKALDKAPFAIGMPEGFLNEANEKQVYDFANNISNNLGEARDYLNEFKKDDNFVSQLVGVMSQDLLYSIPIYNKLRAAGVPKYPAFFISGGFGGAIGIEQKIMGAESTFSQEFFAKDIIELKNLIGIMPNTPEDKIADEVVQALEYGAFSTAIPGIIDAFKFMKRYVPAMTNSKTVGAAGVTVGMTADNEAEGSPLKAIVNAVDNIPMFKSAVVDAAEKIPTVASGDQIFNTIKNTTGVKQSELKWMDLEGFLKGKTKVSKDEVLEYINANRIDVSEVKLSNEGQAGLSTELRKIVDDYETRWRDSDLADAVTPNYDKYNINFTNYGSRSDSLDRVIVDDAVNIPQDFQLLSRNPLIEGMDDFVEIMGTGTPWKTLEKLLDQSGWLNKTTGKYTGILIEVPKEKILMGSWTNDLTFVRANGQKTESFIVTEEKLSNLPNEYTVLTKYEMDPIELERFVIEDEIRTFNKTRMDRGNAPLFEEKYTSPGGEDYKELVFKIKHKSKSIPAELESEFGEQIGNKVKTTERGTVDYKNPYHFNQDNEFANVRFKTRTLDNGKKVLAVEEMQSDLLMASKTDLFANAQKPRFTDPSGTAYGDKTLKDFPFRNNWYEFTIKRLTRYAADNGFDAISIPKGELAANRYGKKINKLKSFKVEPFETNAEILEDIERGGEFVNRSVEPGFVIKLADKNGDAFLEKTIVGLPGDAGFFEDMREVLSKALPEKHYAKIQEMILESTDTGDEVFDFLTNTEIVGSGAGKFRLYDQTIPGYMKKYGKKFNAKVYDYRLSNPENPSIPVTVLELSDEMKTGVQSSSQPLFELLGGVSLATWGAQAVSDNIENNIISQQTN
jgi:hypothetical protein